MPTTYSGNMIRNMEDIIIKNQERIEKLEAESKKHYDYHGEKLLNRIEKLEQGQEFGWINSQTIIELQKIYELLGERIEKLEEKVDMIKNILKRLTEYTSEDWEWDDGYNPAREELLKMFERLEEKIK